jgi:hypothetical protein
MKAKLIEVSTFLLQQLYLVITQVRMQILCFLNLCFCCLQQMSDRTHKNIVIDYVVQNPTKIDSSRGC